MTETFEDFDKSVSWLLESKHEDRLIEEAILSVISRIDKPGSPAGESISHFYADRYGRGPEYIQQIRQMVLGVSLDDLRRVAEQYLKGAEKSMAVVGSPDKMSTLEGFKQFSI